jgi:glycine cleavage system H protein
MSKIAETSQELASYPILADRFYDREHHMWAYADLPQPQQVRVGMDVLGLIALGDLAYVTLQAIGTTVRRGQSIGTLEAAKMTGDLIAPISGTIVARNEAAVSNPALVNQAPYTDGWLVVIEPAAWDSESLQLVAGSDLPAWVAAEMKRYREQGWID